MRSTFLISVLSLFAATTQAQARTYHIRNWCPSSINVYLGGKVLQKNLASNGHLYLNLTDTEGLFYTDANRNSNKSNGTRAGFKLAKPYGYYYMVVDPNNFNVGMSIEPDTAGSPPMGPDDVRCRGISCLAASCTNAFQNNVEPKNLTSYPTDRAPPPPLFSCLDESTPYTVTFCPAERWPPSGLTIHPNGNSNYCLDVKGAKFENGTPVQLYKCNGTPAQKWVINGRSTKVRLQGTDFCLDAGSKPGNSVSMKIWKCYDNLPAQAWYLTGDNRIALEGKGLCLDLSDGKLGNSTKVQTWKCTDNNKNQIWAPS